MPLEDVRELLDNRNLITTGMRADEARRARHGTRTTFVRVLEVHADAIPSSWPAEADAGEVRVVGAPASIDSAIVAVERAIALAGDVPVTAFSLSDLSALAASSGGWRGVFDRLRAAGLTQIADAPLDASDDLRSIVDALHAAGLSAPRVTVHHGPGDREGWLALIRRVLDLQASVGGIRAFAPLPRIVDPAQPSTGYDDVIAVALARLMADSIPSIQVDWALYGPKLAQVALTMGADDVDSISPFEGDLGRRRSPLEEIRGNIAAAGLDAAERDGRFDPRAAVQPAR
jgi:hypothetical protein